MRSQVATIVVVLATRLNAASTSEACTPDGLCGSGSDSDETAVRSTSIGQASCGNARINASVASGRARSEASFASSADSSAAVGSFPWSIRETTSSYVAFGARSSMS